MSDEIKPAMTPEEWAQGHPDDEPMQWYIDMDVGVVDVGIEKASHRHALAALALHGQPFGFTWDDVDLLRAVADGLLEATGHGFLRPLGQRDEEKVIGLADRIAALLPPRE